MDDARTENVRKKTTATALKLLLSYIVSNFYVFFNKNAEN